MVQASYKVQGSTVKDGDNMDLAENAAGGSEKMYVRGSAYLRYLRFSSSLCDITELGEYLCMHEMQRRIGGLRAWTNLTGRDIFETIDDILHEWNEKKGLRTLRRPVTVLKL
ncbi:hypothetical protein BK126_07095 [Paenibacillus sp. FSL H7-0326]|nr:hypothetical protein BK126_07095 [Paenibacillus sp. FSL H7-0326]